MGSKGAEPKAEWAAFASMVKLLYSNELGLTFGECEVYFLLIMKCWLDRLTVFTAIVVLIGTGKDAWVTTKCWKRLLSVVLWRGYREAIILGQIF